MHTDAPHSQVFVANGNSRSTASRTGSDREDHITDKVDIEMTESVNKENVIHDAVFGDSQLSLVSRFSAGVGEG